MIDVTGWIFDGMWSSCESYRGARITEAPSPPLPTGLEVYCQDFDIGGQSGTYIETDAHVRRDGRPVVDLPLEQLVMPVTIIRVGPKGPRERIELEEVRQSQPSIRDGDAVIVATGYDRRWFEADFVTNSPFIGRPAAEYLLEHKIRCLAGDFPKFDNLQAPEFPWDKLWPSDKLVLAPLANVYDCEWTRATLAVFPLKVRGAASAPARAVLLKED
jgi:kynurenine formamidase